MATVRHLSFFTFFTLILLVQARLNLQPADHEALLAICRKLEFLSLQSNRFSGEVSSGLSSLVRLLILDLSNKFSGDLDFVKYFPYLEKLCLANNMFIGKVPASLRSFRNLHSGNSFLEGPFPAMNQLESPSTESNKLVPKRYSFAESDPPSNSPRNQTTEADANSDCLMAPSPSPTSAPTHKNKNKKKKERRYILGILAGFVPTFICMTIFLFLLDWVWNKIKGKKDSGPAIFSQLIKAKELEFLENEDGVAALEIIGRGGCGEVYKREFPEGEVKTIAIRKIIQPPKDASELTEEDTKLLNNKMRQIK